MKTSPMRQRRGQAAVELSLLTIIIVPVTLYVLFLDDLLRIKQNQQETVVSTVWDFTTLNYDDTTKNPSKLYIPKVSPAPKNSANKNITLFNESVQHFNEWDYADHLAASLDFSAPGGGVDTDHHLAIGAHECWMVKGAQQVACNPAKNSIGTGWTDPSMTIGGVNTQVNQDSQGGFYNCYAQVGVINHWLPPKTLMQFSKEELTNKEMHNTDINNNGGGTHSVAGGLDGTKAWIFPMDNYGVVGHPWAMTDQDQADPETRSGPLYDRVNAVYGAPTIQTAIIVADLYPAQAIANGLLGPLTIIDANVAGDLMHTPAVSFDNKKTAWPKGTGPSSNNNHYNSGWKDWAGDKVKATFDNRGTWYMGSTAKP